MNASTPVRQRAPAGDLAGYLFGATMAFSAALTFVMTRAGIGVGMTPEDITLLRFVVPGLVFLPMFFGQGVRTLGGLGLGRGLVLTVVGGIPFVAIQAAGFHFAPLAHGAVVAPATVVIVGTLAGALLLREHLGRAHLLGAAMLLAGIVAIGWDGLSAAAGPLAWLGDLLFIVASLFWSAYTILLRQWRVDPIRAAVVVSVLSMLVTVPWHLATRGPDALAAMPLEVLLPQIAVQGLIGGLLLIVAYSQAIARLGVSRAVLFPAIVPALTVVIGILILGEWPNGRQVAGLALVSAGMLTAVGVLGPLLRRLRAGRP